MADPVARSRRQFLLLVLLFFGPLLVAFFIYYGTDWRPVGTTNKGELIEPAVALPDVPALRRADGERVFRQKWSLVIVSTDGCGAACVKGLEYAQRTLALLGRQQVRTQYLLLTAGNCCRPDLDALGHRALLRIDVGAEPALLAAFPAARREQMIFIVDPMGNLMMRYDSALDPRGLREDLKHLLDLTGVG